VEPSCCSVFPDEIVDVLPDVPDAINPSVATDVYFGRINGSLRPRILVSTIAKEGDHPGSLPS
jgi:hypothetical protein